MSKWREVGPHLQRPDARVAQRRAVLGDRERGGRRPGQRGHDRRPELEPVPDERRHDADRHHAPRQPAAEAGRGPGVFTATPVVRGRAQGAKRAQHSPQDRLHERGGRAGPTKRGPSMTSLRYALRRGTDPGRLRPGRPSAVAQAPVEWYTDTGGGGDPRAAGRARQERRRPGAADGHAARSTFRTRTSAPLHPSPRPRRSSRCSARPRTRPLRRPIAAVPRASQAHSDGHGRPEPGHQHQHRPARRPAADRPAAVAVAGAGLCLLLAGAALRPRRRPAAQR